MIHRHLLVIALLILCCYFGFTKAVAQDSDRSQNIELNEDKVDQDVPSLDKRKDVGQKAPGNESGLSPKAKKSLEKSKKKIESRTKLFAPTFTSSDETKAPEKKETENKVQPPLNLLKPQLNLKKEVESEKKKETGVPIVIAGEELFRIKAKLGPYTPEIRAHSITQRLAQLEKSDNLKDLVEDIKVEESDYSTDIIAGDLTLMTEMQNLKVSKIVRHLPPNMRLT